VRDRAKDPISFTRYCLISPEFAMENQRRLSALMFQQVGPADAEVRWPVGIAAGRNQGVAAKINEIDGAIGYIDRL
jgi:ABC-type phosphate transport system substrate-binding protein